MPSFARVCEAVAEAWRERRDEVLEHAGRLTEAIDEQVMRPGRPGRPVAAAAARGLRQRRRRVRAELRRLRLGAEVPARDDARVPPARLRPQRVAADARDDHDDTRRDGRGRHVRPGRRRLRPLLHRRLLARAALREDALRQRAARRARTCTRILVTGKPRYQRIVEETIEYVLRDLRHPEGGFFSAEDADSEGIEGKFYLWSLDEIARGLRRRRRRA